MLRRIQEYLADKRVLILDKSSTSRQLIEKSLHQLGIDKALISSLKSYDHALDFIQVHKPDIIFTDFKIYDRFGLDLVHYQKEYIQDQTKRIFIVVTENATDSAVADAAEEEVDGYILKPFTIDTITEHLRKIISLKLEPNTYQLTIAKGKASLAAGNLHDATIHFEKAVNLSAKPSLALYYLGEICRKQQRPQEALHYFKQGQKITPMHFRSIVAEFMMLFELREFDEAYEVLAKINRHYPISPKILTSAFSFYAHTFKFDEVEKYYQLFLQLERKTADLKRTLSLAMLEAGKDLIQRRKADEALDYFLKGSVISGNKPEYILEAADTLLVNHLLDEAESFVKMFNSEELGIALYKQLTFKITNARMPYDRVIEEGKIIIGEGLASPEIYVRMFELLKNTQHKQLLESLIYKAIDQFPDRKSFFAPYLPR